MAKKDKMKMWVAKITRSVTQSKEITLAGTDKHIVQEKCKLLAKKIDWSSLPVEDEMVSIVGGCVNPAASVTFRKNVRCCK